VIAEGAPPEAGAEVQVRVEVPRRRAIERHHTVTHLLHWALHEIVSRDAVQKGSYVGPEKLTFDFSSAALTPEQVREVEKLVNERIVENAHVSWIEMPYTEVKTRPDIMQFFGDKYGDTVRVVQIGGEPRALDGYSMELCGGTHVRGTGEIGLFRIVGEAAIAAGVRRVEAVAGLNAFEQAKRDQEFIRSIAGKLNSPIADLEKRIESMLTQQKALEKAMKSLEQKQAIETARQLISKAQPIGATPAIIELLDAASGDQLQAVTDALKQQQFSGVAVLAGTIDGTVALAASVAPEFTSKIQAGKIIQAIAPIIGGKGGGRPDHARGSGKDASKLAEAFARARELIAG
jgi:alanyl-tRNA synthetase